MTPDIQHWKIFGPALPFDRRGRRRDAAWFSAIRARRSEASSTNSRTAERSYRSLRTLDHRCVCEPSRRKGGFRTFSAGARFQTAVTEADIRGHGSSLPGAYRNRTLDPPADGTRSTSMVSMAIASSITASSSCTTVRTRTPSVSILRLRMTACSSTIGMTRLSVAETASGADLIALA